MTKVKAQDYFNYFSNLWQKWKSKTTLIIFLIYDQSESQSTDVNRRKSHQDQFLFQDYNSFLIYLTNLAKYQSNPFKVCTVKAT